MRLKGLGALPGNERGASAVEFAAVIAPLLLIILGVFEYGRAIYTRQALHETALQTARCMGILQTSCALNGAVDPDASVTFALAVSRNWWIALEADEVAVDTEASCGGVGDFSEVVITHEFQTALPSIVTDFVDATTLQTTACFPNSTPPST